MAARVGSHEREQQPVEPFRYYADAPEFERYAQVRPLLVVEIDGSARPEGLEPLDDRLASGDVSELLEQHVALVPGDLDDLSRYSNLHPVEPVGHGPESTT